MVETCAWDQAFTMYTKKENISIVILYWYLFNKPDFQGNIARVMSNLRKKDEYKKIIPSYIAYPNNIGDCLRKMEEHNLVGISETRNRELIYQALSFFYLDTFCIKTPGSVRESIKAHYKEYCDHLEELEISIAEWIDLKKLAFLGGGYYWPTHAFSTRKDNSVIPAQKIFQYYSPEPKEFMKWISFEEIDHIVLLELIKESFQEISDLCSTRLAWLNVEWDYWESKEAGDTQEAEDIKGLFLTESLEEVGMLNLKRAASIIEQNTIELIRKYGIVNWFGGEMKNLLAELDKRFSAGEEFFVDEEKRCWDILTGHAGRVAYYVKKQLKLYRQIKRGNISFNEETLKFE